MQYTMTKKLGIALSQISKFSESYFHIFWVNKKTRRILPQKDMSFVQSEMASNHIILH